MKVKDLREVMDDCWFVLTDCEDTVIWDEKKHGEIPCNLLNKKAKYGVAWTDPHTDESYIGVEI